MKRFLKRFWAIPALLIVIVAIAFAQGRFAGQFRSIKNEGDYTGLGNMSNAGTLTQTGAATFGAAVTFNGAIANVGTFSLTAPNKFGTITSEAAATDTLVVAESGTIFLAALAGTNTFALPTPSASTVGVYYYFLNTVDQNMLIKSTVTDGNAIIADGVLTTDLCSFSTSSHKIGSAAMAIGVSATKWQVLNLGGTAMTVEAAD